MISRDVILRNDNPFKTEFIATITSQGKNYKLNRAGYMMLSMLIAPQSEESFKKIYSEASKKFGIELGNNKHIDFLTSGVDLGLITTELYDYKHCIEIPEAKFSFLTKPYRFPEDIIISLTGVCNLECRHCMAIDISETRSLWTYNRLVEIIDELDYYGLKNLKISGRESTLFSDIWDIVEYATSKRFATTILTNGLLLNDNNIELLGELKERKQRGFNIAISLDGHDEESHEFLRGKNTFMTTINNLRKLVAKGIKPSINVVVHKKNYNSLNEMILLLIDIGIEFVTFGLLMDIGEKKSNNEIEVPMNNLHGIVKELEKLKIVYEDQIKITIDAKHLKHLRSSVQKTMPINVCHAGITSMYINHDGDVYPCVEGAGIKELVVGNVLDKTVKSVWDSSSWHLYRGGWSLENIISCNNCELADNCNLVNCRIYPYVQHGSFFKPVNACRI